MYVTDSVGKYQTTKTAIIIFLNVRHFISRQ